MKLFQFSCVYMLPDDFDGDMNDALEHLIRYRKTLNHPDIKYTESNKITDECTDDDIRLLDMEINPLYKSLMRSVHKGLDNRSAHLYRVLNYEPSQKKFIQEN